MSFLVFDIETRVDKALVHATQFRGETLSEEAAFERMREELRATPGGGDGFFPVTYHVPICVVLGEVGPDHVLRGVEELRADAMGEEGLVRAFWQRIEALEGTLVSFNGRGFDLPVLELQGLRFGCQARTYFGERNGLRSRWGRHDDLYDFLSNFGAARLRGGFDVLAKLVGLPGKGTVSGADVQRLWEEGRLDEIGRYCRQDVIQTYFLFLRVQHLRGRLTTERLTAIEERTRSFRAELEP